MHSSSQNTHSKIVAFALVLLLSALWLLMRGYHGLTGDAQIYAFQALARIHPHLATDLYLQNVSQDRFTIFSPFYAWCIGLFGLENAARLLAVIFTIWLLAAAWTLARITAGRDGAWLGVAFLLIVAGDYGGSAVFRISEPYLTARLPAEALILTALACFVGGKKRLSVLLAMAALLVHPLLALPGSLVLLCMWLPARAIAAGAVGGLLFTLVSAVTATFLPIGIEAMAVIDPAWLDVVQERSQFLFLQLWSSHDWDTNTQPFIYLAFTAIAVPDARIRKLCTGSALVGAAGLAVALIGSLIGPAAMLVQGQAWRWVWIAVFVSALLLPVTALHVWRDERCGPLCVLLLASGWTVSSIDGTACASLALLLWVMRANISARAAPYFRWAAAALAIAIMAWILARSSALMWPATTVSAPPLRGAQMRDVFGLRITALLFGVLVWWTIQRSRGAGGNILAISVAALLVMISIFVWPAALKQAHNFASVSEIDEFAEWRNEIPPTSTVLVVPARDVGAFVWFILDRPNYLALDQSAGVVFSRATALEVRRRSEVLLPLTAPIWKIMTGLANSRSGHQDAAATRPLTAESLIRVCEDPLLGFVISPVRLGFQPLRHEHAGAWQDSNLYDCRKVRASLPAT